MPSIVDSTMPIMTKQRLRIATFNVHGFTNGHGEKTFDGICEALFQADLDIIGLQEVPAKFLGTLVHNLNNKKRTRKGNATREGCFLKRKQNGYAMGTNFGGTVILTRLPIIDCSRGRGSQGRSNTCQVVLPSSHVINIIVVHLSHRKEKHRLQEIRAVEQVMQMNDLPPFDLWLGDFNALTRDDYTTSEWDEISRVRSRNRWELPVSTLTTALTTSSCKRTKKRPVVENMGLTDAFSSLPRSRRKGPQSTCRYGTRIDYVYYMRDRWSDAGWNAVACEHHDVKELSDHNLVVATFEYDHAV